MGQRHRAETQHPGMRQWGLCNRHCRTGRRLSNLLACSWIGFDIGFVAKAEPVSHIFGALAGGDFCGLFERETSGNFVFQ